MKKILMIAALGFGVLGAEPSSAQVRFNVNVNVGQQPAWGPRGYNHVDYYYLPDIDAYYYVPQKQFIYMDRGRWITTYTLPARYRTYDLYKINKVVINEPRPYLRHNYYRTKYVHRPAPNRVIIREQRNNYYGGYRKGTRVIKHDNRHGHDHDRH